MPTNLTPAAETVESRLDLIRRLERRFGPTLEDVLTAQKSMQEEYEHLNGLEDQVERMGAEHKRAACGLPAVCPNLDPAPHRAGTQL